MWMEIAYKPTALFSLKLSSATNSAGKSLPCPSPYSVKMALLNAIITYDSLETARLNFSLVKNLELFFFLPESFVINNCMIKILKDNDKVSPALRTIEPFKSTVAFREYVYLSDEIRIAFNISALSDEQKGFLEVWFPRINYFGKRGSFFQFSGIKIKKALPDNYVSLLRESYKPGVMFPMDDVDKTAEFKNMNNYNFQIKNAKRVSKVYIFPYKQVEANKSYSLFVRY